MADDIRVSHPNFLFIIADQFRYDHIQAAGADFVSTPHLNRLLKHGMHFTHSFTNCPLCAPARISLATGIRPELAGAMDNSSYLSLTNPTMYMRLRDHGYRVAMVGKHDLAKSDHFRGQRGNRPLAYAYGFTDPHETLGKMEAGKIGQPFCPYTTLLERQGWLEQFVNDYRHRQAKGWIKGVSHGSILPEELYHDTYIGRYATQWLREIDGDFPWFFHVGFIGPHDPFDPPSSYENQYKDKQMPSHIPAVLEDKPQWHQQRRLTMSKDEVNHTRQQYAAEVQLLDEHIGAMLEVLEQRGMLDQTIIIFTSDHGEMLGDHLMYTKGVAYDSAIRVPLIFSGPGIPKDHTTDALVELMDLNPTIMDYAGIPPQQGIEARSLMPILQNPVENKTHRSCIVSMMRNWRLVRDHTYKYVENFNDRYELYDLHEDPSELLNCIDEHPDMVRTYSRMLNEEAIKGAYWV
jgi:arylsulfatase